MNPALVILAAGASTRLGECKALARLGSTTPLEHLLRAGVSCDAARALVITGADHARIAERAPRSCDIERNEAWASGRTGSVQVALRCRPGLDLCLAPVDVPLVPAAVFEALCAAWAEAGAPARGWLAPRLPPVAAEQGPARFGHPIVVGRALLLELERFTPATPLRELRERAEPLLALQIPHPEILDDLDERADLERLRARLTDNSS